MGTREASLAYAHTCRVGRAEGMGGGGWGRGRPCQRASTPARLARQKEGGGGGMRKKEPCRRTFDLQGEGAAKICRQRDPQ
eukprot:357945-Chlamydomonas_euryale.AAC.2